MTPTHLTPEELIDLVEGELDPSRAAHANGCTACQREVASLRESVSLAQRVDVPEPSPLFWPRQTERITTALAEAAPGRPWWRLLHLWRLAAAASVVAVAVVVGVTIGDSAGDRNTESGGAVDQGEALAPEAGASDEAAWTLLLTVAEGVNWEGPSDDAWPVDAGAIDGAVSQLSAVELRDLVRLLEAELEGSSL